MALFMSVQLFAGKNKFDPHVKVHPDTAKLNIQNLMDELAVSHPGFYRYTSKDQFDQFIDSIKLTITDSIGTLAFYRKMKPLIAKIGCLHTGITLSEDYETYLEDSLKLLPFEVYISEDDEVFISKNYSTVNAPIHSQLLSINGQSIHEVLKTLYNAIPSDGYNQTLKKLMLNHRLAFWYRTVIQNNNFFDVELKVGNQLVQHRLQGTTSDGFPTMKELQKRDEQQLLFKIENGIGYLTVRSFAKSTIKKGGQKFKKFIDQAFEELREKQIDQLVIDVRYNSGGSDSHAAYLISHFFDEPFDYWDKIEITEKVAQQIKGINRIFFRKPTKVDTTYLWQGSALYKEFDFYHLEPARQNFLGNVYIITNGLCMSSCADFAGVLSYNQRAFIVGQESGGGFQGNTSGLMPTVDLDPNMELTVPLLKYTNAVDMTKNFGRGSIPDYPVYPSLDQWINEVDVEMKFIKDLISEQAN